MAILTAEQREAMTAAGKTAAVLRYNVRYGVWLQGQSAGRVFKEWSSDRDVVLAWLTAGGRRREARHLPVCRAPESPLALLRRLLRR